MLRGYGREIYTNSISRPGDRRRSVCLLRKDSLDFCRRQRGWLGRFRLYYGKGWGVEGNDRWRFLQTQFDLVSRTLYLHLAKKTDVRLRANISSEKRRYIRIRECASEERRTLMKESTDWYLCDLSNL